MRLRNAVLFLVIVVLFSCLASFAQQNCSISGTWYGGGSTNAKYLMTITPIRPGRYSVVFTEGFTPAVAKLSTWSGEFNRMKHSLDFEGFSIALMNFDLSSPLAGGAAPDIWAVHSVLSMIDCDTVTNSLDFYGVYKWGKIPFVDTPDSLRNVTIETYRRMPTRCESVGCPPNE